jgi:regulator of cell morphogenesis and NO signaling
MRDPIERLLWEHQGIMRQVDDLRVAVRALQERGPAALAEALPALRGTARMIETELLAHARREDEALFPAIERVLGDTAGPTVVMRMEHRDIHAQADLFRATLKQLNEVEHPAIVAGGERLKGLAARGDDAAALLASGAEIVRLLDEHFGKEEHILFPMTREVLEPEELDEVSRRMDALDAG